MDKKLEDEKKILSELEEDLNELRLLLPQAKRKNVSDKLIGFEKELETSLKNGQQALQKLQDAASKKDSCPENKRFLADINEYAWDQSNKFVKIFVTLKGVQSCTDANIETTYAADSFKLIVRNVKNKDYCFTIKNLLNPIDAEKSYHKIKTDMVAIYMKKVQENEQWSNLTLTEKRAKEAKDNAMKMDDEDKNDPIGGIMNLMKKMYNSGDPELQRIIAKAWTESQEKAQGNQLF